MTEAEHSRSCDGSRQQGSEGVAGSKIEIFTWRIQPRPDDAKILSTDERLRAARSARHEDGARFASGRATVRRILGKRLNLSPRTIKFQYGSHGRPEVREAPELSFNLSHSGDRALLAVADGIDIGVDIERLRRGLHWRAIAERVLGAGERAELEAAVPGDDSARFLELWTVREAYLKAVGVGIDALGRELPGFLHGNDREIGWRFARVPVDSGYTASVVWKGPERPVVKRDL